MTDRIIISSPPGDDKEKVKKIETIDSKDGDNINKGIRRIPYELNREIEDILKIYRMIESLEENLFNMKGEKRVKDE